MREITGGITAARGFKASGVHCGIRKNRDKKDLALIVSECRAAAAAVYTKNLVKGAPIEVTRKNIADGYASAVICNSGNANTCNADGPRMAEDTCLLVERHTGIPAKDVIVASTGVIGQPLDITPIAEGMPKLVGGLGGSSEDAEEAIMTTDIRKKSAAVEFQLNGITCRMGGIAKGSGMICPNMATMLCFITTDAAVAPDLLQKALSAAVEDTFNMVSVDGDTSTNDMVSVMANGMAGNRPIDSEGGDYQTFLAALRFVSESLARMVARDGEGASKLLECSVRGAKTKDDARRAAKAVIGSSLVKTAMFGADANWGRVLCALGYAGADIDADSVNIAFKSENGAVEVCRGGAGIPFSEETAKAVLLADSITIDVSLKSGDFDAVAWGCDLTHGYVDINGSYRS